MTYMWESQWRYYPTLPHPTSHPWIHTATDSHSVASASFQVHMNVNTCRLKAVVQLDRLYSFLDKLTQYETFHDHAKDMDILGKKQQGDSHTSSH